MIAGPRKRETSSLDVVGRGSAWPVRETPRPHRFRALAITLAACVLAVAAVLTVRYLTSPNAAADGLTPTSAAIEKDWGVRFMQVGISADGGMVDVRYTVLDADRASTLAATAEQTPVLMDEASGRSIFSVAMKAHVHDIHNGGRYYLLYRNTAGLLRPGEQVSITVGGDRLEHVVVLGSTSE